ncbi:serine hydrolase domain-containing protein [Actinoplanes derwentensis]|uniref:CubicO group peptidase, beta-lactamase class C family n=1 Tax=Actinoplanes derwentensis TaxID=113562 RepID=A0A1H2AS61_9ACTN|nr:serine hydrolase domain-containing protein [Actinoplanes derwentensis]GID84362.1 penicillin-binding protein [Actinoplanes derwentensis]SDT48627.1 CubicO group peptidase, beta-lactamase class C family [Actinoplanes derwentensis]
MTDDLLADFVRADQEQDLGAYGIHVHQEGKPPIEHRFRSDDRVNLYSVAKTFTAVALGLAEAEGRLTLDDRLLDHLPELRPLAADGFEDVTLRHLTLMTSGSGLRWHAHERIDAADLLHDIVAAPLVAAPGTRYAYTGTGPYAVGRVIARATGANLRDYLLPRLFQPLDLHNPAWHCCPLGFPFAESSLFLTTSELARFARLLLQDGEWEGRQIIPADFVRGMVADPVATGYRGHLSYGYGFGVWIGRDDTYRMDGAYGQFAVIAPAHRAAITVTAHSTRDADLLTAVHDLVLSRLAP